MVEAITMREPFMLEFPASEYKKRLKLLMEKMEENAMDAVILTTKENTRYFTGYQLIVWGSGISKPACAIITKDGEVTMVSGYSNREALKVTTWVEDLRIWDPLGRDDAITNLPDAIYDVLTKKGLAKGKIGMETGVGFRIHMNTTDYSKLMGHLQDAAIIDAGPSIWDLRAIKSELEISHMKNVCNINIKAYEKALNSIYPGMTELELFREISKAMFEFGADEVFPLGIRAGAERYTQSNCPPSERPIEKGEIILIDGGPGCKGYYSDIIREAIIGQPSDRQKELYDFSVAACEKGLEFIKPGVTAGEVCQVVDEFVDAHGYGKYYETRGWVGHSIGVSIHEMPTFELGSELILKSGMVFAIEPAFYEEGEGWFGIEENILITDKGYELLTPLKRDLWIL
ncbi:Xaa-Pro peptidase family protein [Fictibacillus sp. WQ 8-8]|uniref:Peptidase M24 n=1 Tax=Fictibacillus arsenicus TaxID=255247 RepID=A0A1B1Z2M8_9BACL|nr:MULTISPECIES: Xaa-Pro peptidase family protein [Fictibacillus]ANX11654.1 hypothetical protein ABE41_006510 [Fictibacillus arsenicus]MCQ6266321.1 Xaa-Pro peptidase family protein [Fictibacillus sp. WQ 8-8]